MSCAVLHALGVGECGVDTLSSTHAITAVCSCLAYTVSAPTNGLRHAVSHCTACIHVAAVGAALPTSVPWIEQSTQ